MDSYVRWREYQQKLEEAAALLKQEIAQLEGEKPDDPLMPLVLKLSNLVEILVHDRGRWKRVG